MGSLAPDATAASIARALDDILLNFAAVDLRVVWSLFEATPELLSEESAARLEALADLELDPGFGQALRSRAALIRKSLDAGLGAQTLVEAPTESEPADHSPAELDLILRKLAILQDEQHGAAAMLGLCEHALVMAHRDHDRAIRGNLYAAKGDILLGSGAQAANAAVLEDAAAAFSAAIEIIGPGENAVEWATLQQNRAMALQLAGEITGDDRSLASAIDGYTAALTIFTRDASADSWITIEQNRAGCRVKLGQMLGEAWMLRDALARYEDIQTVRTRSADPAGWAIIEQDRAVVLQTLGETVGDPQLIADAIAGYSAALEAIPRGMDVAGSFLLEQYGAAARASLGELTSNPEMLRAALSGYDGVLARDHEMIDPLDRAALVHDRGNVLLRLAILADDRIMLKDAIAAQDLALETLTRDVSPVEWANILQDRAAALRSLGDLDGDVTMLRAAIQAYDDAFEVRTRHDHPVDWAFTRQNKAIALMSLGELLADEAIVRDAISEAETALEVLTRERLPSAWGTVQHNRAQACRILGEISFDPEHLVDAITGSDRALTVHDRSTSPALWTMIQQNKAGALQLLGALTGDHGLFRAATVVHEDVLSSVRRDTNPVAWGQAQHNYADALARAGEMRGDPALLQNALAGFGLALEVRTRDDAPVRWATTLQNSAGVLRILGELTGDPSMMRESIARCELALGLVSRADRPKHWARLQQNRANALTWLGEISADPSQLVEAIECFDAALEEFKPDEDPNLWMTAHQNRANALVWLGAATHDAEKIRAAVAIFDMVAKGSGQNDGKARKALSQLNRASAFASLHDQFGEPDALDAALAAARVALDGLTMTESPDQCMAAYALSARLLLDRRAYQEVRALLDEALSHGLDHLLDLANQPARERAVEQAAGLAEMRAWIAIAIDRDPCSALLWLEHGRAQLLAMALTANPPLPVEARRENIAELLKAIPDGGAGILPIVTQAGAYVAIVPAGRQSVFVDDFLELPTLDRDRMESWFYGPTAGTADGYLASYEDHRFNWTGGTGADGRAFPKAVREALAECWSAFLAPVEARLEQLGLSPGATVVIVPPGLLSLLPLWAAMPDSDDGAPFGARWTVTQAPNLQTLAVVQHRDVAWQKAGANVSALAVLDPAAQGQRRLAGSALEGDSLMARLSPSNAKRLTGASATREALLANLPGRTHLHISAHGFYSPKLPGLSALLLAGDDRLTLGDLQLIDAVDSLRLVVLPACDTALTGIQRGRTDEFIGFPAGFVRAGAAAVIASHWPVRDDATFFLIWKFYEEHLDGTARAGQSPAAALRIASLWLRDVTCAELASTFEPARMFDGTIIEGVIDRNRPQKGRFATLPIFVPVSEAEAAPLRAARPIQPAPAAAARTDRLTGTALEALAANPAFYRLPFQGPMAERYRPFSDPIFWAAFSITGL